MAIYQYLAFDQQGVRQSGRLEAGSREAADSALRQRGLYIRQLKEVRPSIWSKEVVLGGRSVSQEQISVTCRQLATLVGAGIGISESLRTLAEEMPKGPLKEALLDVDAGIRAGRSLADCMAEHHRVFPMVMTNLVLAGEATGDLDGALEEAAQILEKQRVTSGKIRSALTYPLVVISFAIALTIFMLTAVIPTLVQTFAAMDATLPWPTRAVMAASGWVMHYWWVMALTVVLLVLAYMACVRDPRGRLAVDRVLLRIPIFGMVVRKTAIAQLARCLGTMVKSAVPVLDALNITAQVVGNRAIGQVLLEARESLQAGGTISGALKRSAIFPSVVVQMIRVGEESGAVDAMLLKVAEAYEMDVDLTMGRLEKLLEPVMIVILGGVVGVLVLAAILPTFSLVSQL